MNSTFLPSLVFLLALCATAAFGQGSATSTELSAKALFYNAGGEISQVGSATPNPTQTAVASKPTAVKRPLADTAVHPLAMRASVLLVTDGGKTVELKPSHKFHAGDRVKLAFSTNKSGYFYLATIGSSGKVQILAPRPGEPVRIEAGNRYTFPSTPTGFFRFDSNKGQEVIWAVLSDEPMAAINMGNGMVAQLPQQPGTATSADPAILAGKVVAVADVANDLSGKDLVFEEDSTALFASARPASFVVGSNTKPPVVVKLILQHE